MLDNVVVLQSQYKLDYTLRSLGFIIHPDKSVVRPTQSIQYLGVITATKAMSVTLTQEKKENLKACCSHLLQKQTMKTREVAKVIGLMVSSCPAVKNGPLHYRQLENDKKAALAANRGHYDSDMRLSISAKDELRWWMEVIQEASNDVLVSEPEETVTSDASSIGWGCEYSREPDQGELGCPQKRSFISITWNSKQRSLPCKVSRHKLVGRMSGYELTIPLLWLRLTIIWAQAILIRVIH